jgi:predicted flap endonuclease-1-like 5' DNA nuclease
MLEEDLQKQLEVRYQGYPIKSIHLIEMGVENSGHAVVKNQTFTVKFSADAQILGELESESSPEDLRYIRRDRSADSGNQRRFVIDLLQKGRSVTWKFIVINQQNQDFHIYPGVVEKDEEKVDFDVETAVTEERIQVNLVQRIKRIVYLIIGTLALMVLREVFTPPLRNLIVPMFNLLIGGLLMWAAQQASDTVIPFMNWIRETREAAEKPEYDVDISNCAYALVGPGNSLKAITGFDEVLRDILAQHLLKDFPFDDEPIFGEDSLLAIEGIGRTYNRRLQDAGAESRSDLLRIGARSESRWKLAQNTDISEKIISRWVRQADLMRVPGIGSQYAEILEKIGIESVPQLADSDPGILHSRMEQTNREKRFVRRLPDVTQLQKWIKEAKTLPELIIE